MNDLKVGDRVGVRSLNGEIAGTGTIANINEFREPSVKYAIDADFYKGDLLFAGENQLKLIKEIDKND